MKALTRGLVWFKSTDLRLSDHLPYINARQTCEHTRHVYVFNPIEFGFGSKGYVKSSNLKLKFLLECVNDVSQSLRQLGHELELFIGNPENLIHQYAKQHGIEKIFTYNEIADEEVQTLHKTIRACQARGIPTDTYWEGNSLFTIDELPFPIENLEYFTSFRKAVEMSCVVSKPQYCQIDSVKESSAPQNNHDELICHLIPNKKSSTELLAERMAERQSVVNFDEFYALLQQADNKCDEITDAKEIRVRLTDGLPTDDTRSAVLNLRGGERAALERLNYYFGLNQSNATTLPCVLTYKETRNGMIGLDFSTKFCLHLSRGCISPRVIYAALKQAEEIYGANESTYWVFFELLWRDYFRFYGLRYGKKMFYLGGVQGKKGKAKYPWREDTQILEAWREGRTGYPYIDANMRELLHTGFMSNRGRQNVASFLVRDLLQDWRHGAEYFECMLLDYDVCSNYGNWQYAAGVGSDPREDRYFNIVKQASNYDPNADYIRRWCPELSSLPTDVLLDIRKLTPAMRSQFNISYEVLPEPIAPLALVPPSHFSGMKGGSKGGSNDIKKGSKQWKKRTGHGGVPGLEFKSGSSSKPYRSNKKPMT